MGAWIEIEQRKALLDEAEASHPTMGSWIEINIVYVLLLLYQGRTLQWVRGLK